MGLLNSIVGWLVAFGAGFFGHVVAHDFCEVTPMISSKIIEAAASRLPAAIRDRYREEWRADLRDQHGALAKLTWSFGCFISARRMRREVYQDQMRRTSFELTFENGETIAFNRTTYAVFIAGLQFGQYRALLKWAPTPIRLLALRCVFAIPTFKFRQWGPPAYDPLRKLLMQANDEGEPTKITYLVDGVAVKSATIRSGEVIDETA
jgi:hypothetical protein